MSSTPSASNTNKTFSVTPSDNLSSETSYKIRVTTLVKDVVGNSMSNSYTTSNGFTTADVTAPILSQVTAITTPTNDNTSSYIFSSTEAGTITYGGSCSSSTTSATIDNNTVTFNALADGTYNNCTITVTDSASNASSILDVNTFVVDTTAPWISGWGITITTPTNDNTPDYSFSSSEAGTITYYGGCSSSTTSATTGKNTVTFNTLSDGTYSACVIFVTDSAGNVSNTFTISFVIDTTAPTVSSIYPTDNQSGVSISDNISVTFSEAMYTTSVTTNTDNTTCYGSLQMSSDNFSSCVQMFSSPSSSNSDKTFTVDPSDNLSYSTTYKIRVTTGVKDKVGYSLGSQYETSSGFTIPWTKQLGTSSSDHGYGVTMDSSNNLYVVGTTDGGLDNNTYSGGTGSDIVLVKYNFSGTYQWTQQLGTSSSDSGQGVTVDSSNNIYVTGFTEGGLDGNTNSGGQDIFLVKYNSSGTKQWTKQLGTSGRDEGNGVTVDSSDNIYVTGFTEGGLDNNTNAGGFDLFLVKYNSSGVKQWTKQLGTSSGGDLGRGVTVDSSDNIYVTGSTFGGLDGNTNWGGHDIFLVKYNSSGTKQWTQQFGNLYRNIGSGVTVDSYGNVYVTGNTEGGLYGNTNSGSLDIFLVKYNSSGTKQWTQQLGTSSDDLGRGVAVDSSDNIYVTGWTQGGLDGNTNSGDYDMFLVKYNSSGTKQWTQQLGTSSYDSGYGVTVDSSDNVYVTGGTSGGLDGNTNSGSGDIFLMKFNSDGVKQ